MLLIQLLVFSTHYVVAIKHKFISGQADCFPIDINFLSQLIGVSCLFVCPTLDCRDDCHCRNLCRSLALSRRQTLKKTADELRLSQKRKEVRRAITLRQETHRRAMLREDKKAITAPPEATCSRQVDKIGSGCWAIDSSTLRL